MVMRPLQFVRSDPVGRMGSLDEDHCSPSGRPASAAGDREPGGIGVVLDRDHQLARGPFVSIGAQKGPPIGVQTGPLWGGLCR
jgi:hypothetical protein